MRPAILVAILGALGGTSAILISCEASPKRGGASSLLPPYATTTPLSTPRLFAEGVVSTADDELGATLSPDGTTLYFAKRTPSTIASSVVVICVSRFEGGAWKRPEIAAFSGRFFDYSPSFAPDGKRLFFSSSRPVGGAARADSDIWVVDAEADGSWSEPRNLGRPIDTDAADQNACVAADGTLYFASTRPGGKGGFDLYRAKWEDGAYHDPENLGDAINTEASETQPYVSPDQKLLVFASLGRADARIAGGSPYPRPDLYVSTNENGAWTPARHLPAPINTDASEAYPYVSPDGRYLFFTSERNFTSIPMRRPLTYDELERRLHSPGNGLGDLYQVDIEALWISLAPRTNR
ncbi:MAG: PD40 domain-containing protein [Planctomycetes bacterium]|nr:PD40 domain-containing protein [Planctomycetota bacterium]MBI3848204.1 PD40 domain-containing protein [Planctomycetota bacterium]